MPRVHIENIKDLNPLADYHLVDYDAAMFADSYYGYKDSVGSWYIVVQSGMSQRYAKGDSDYDTNWTNRNLIPYDYYSVVF